MALSYITINAYIGITDYYFLHRHVYQIGQGSILHATSSKILQRKEDKDEVEDKKEAVFLSKS